VKANRRYHILLKIETYEDKCLKDKEWNYLDCTLAGEEWRTALRSPRIVCVFPVPGGP